VVLLGRLVSPKCPHGRVTLRLATGTLR